MKISLNNSDKLPKKALFQRSDSYSGTHNSGKGCIIELSLHNKKKVCEDNNISSDFQNDASKFDLNPSQQGAQVSNNQSKLLYIAHCFPLNEYLNLVYPNLSP